MTIFHMNCSTNGNEIKSLTEERWKEGETEDADCRSQLQKWPNNRASDDVMRTGF